MVTVVVSGPTLKREFIKRGFVMPRLSSSFNSTGSVLTTCWAVNCYGSLSSPGASDRRSILWPAVLISGRVGHLVSLHMYILHSITVHVYIRPNRGKCFVILYSSQPPERQPATPAVVVPQDLQWHHPPRTFCSSVHLSHTDYIHSQRPECLG